MERIEPVLDTLGGSGNGRPTEDGNASSSLASSIPIPSPMGESDRQKPQWRDPTPLSLATTSPAPVQQGTTGRCGTANKHGAATDKLSGRVRVLVRCRPLTANEEGHTNTRIHVRSDTVVVNDATAEGDARQFRFDTVLPPSADQAATFMEVEPLIDHVLDGFHATVFAYGQTGSGKTYTMEGLSHARMHGQHRARRRPPHRGETEEEGWEGEEAGTAAAPVSTAAEEHGIMPRAIQLLFDRARLRQGDDTLTHPSGEPDESAVQYTFRCSYYQIYNEVVSDLLRPEPHVEAAARGTSGRSTRTARRDGDMGGGLKIRWQANNTFRVQNLFLCECDTPGQMRTALVAGVQQKVMGSHLMNEQSSRSHCVFTVYVECRKVKTGDLVSRSELSMVDLAGSEKLSLLASNPTAKLVKESIDINTSLLALGKVITALAAGSQKAARLLAKRSANADVDGKRGNGPQRPLLRAAPAAVGHVPYRDSKLTMLLKHALGGNSLTLMVACISPSDRYVEESVSTLLFAGRASNIENVPQVNEDPTAALIRQLRDEIRQLKEELRSYRNAAAKGLLPGNAAATADIMAGATPTPALASEALLAMERTTNAETTTRESARSRHEELQKQSDTLADSLMTACEMLQQMFATNGQLRDAYDVVKEAKEAAGVREVQLNAENIALRERIQALEAIVLDGRTAKAAAAGILGDDEDEDEDEDEDAKGEEETDDDEERATRGTRRVAWDERKAPSRALPTAGKAKPCVAADDADKFHPSSPAHLCGSTGEPKLTKPTGAGEEPRRQQRVSTEAPGGVVESTPSFSSPHGEQTPVEAQAERGQPRPSKQRKSDKKKERRRHRQHQKLAQRLEAYEERYRSPYARGSGVAGTGSYASYYGRAAKATGRHPARSDDNTGASAAAHATSTDGAPAISSTAVRRQLLASRRDMQHTVASTVVEVRSLAQKLPDAITAEFIPQSLKHSRTYGALAFSGGDGAQAAAFEAKRQDREARRQALLARQEQLLANIHTVIAERQFHPLQPARDANRVDGDDEPAGAAAVCPTPPRSSEANEMDTFQSPPHHAASGDNARRVGVNVLSLKGSQSLEWRSASADRVPRVYAVAERSAPRWEAESSLGVVRAVRHQPQGTWAAPVARDAPFARATASLSSVNPYSLQEASTVRSRRRGAADHARQTEKLSSMDKLLQYLESQRE